MYHDYYSFQDKPFNLTPDPRFIFLSRNHREAFAHLLYGINNHAGFISLTGEVGSGKTTVLRTLLNQLDCDRYRTALIFNPPLTPNLLLRSIAHEFGILSYPPAVAPVSSDSADIDMLERLNHFLLKENAEKRTVVLVIDEAQALDEKVLEQIRLISNLETDSDKLIQIILSGQPELLQLLKKESLRQLDQRITVRHHLKPMPFSDTQAYINHRIEIAKGRIFFSRRAVAKIYHYSRGLPRLINAACDRALLAGYTRNVREINARIAAAGIRDLEREIRLPVLKRPVIVYPLLLTAALLAASPLAYKVAKSSAFNPPPPVSDIQKAALSLVPKPEKAVFSTVLEKSTEPESLRAAFNVMARIWKVPPVTTPLSFPIVHTYFHERELRLHSFSGSLESLRRIDCPAILELLLPGKSGKRYAALVGTRGDKLFLELPSSEKELVQTDDIEKYWTGHAYVPWRNFSRLPAKLMPGARGHQVREIQELLNETGIPIPQLTDSYDERMQAAIRRFQVRNRVEPDGIAGSRTLLLLYRSIDRFGIPRLEKQDRYESHP